MVISSARNDKFYGWIALTGAALVSFVIMGGLMGSFGLFLPSICKEFGWSRGAVSGAFLINMLLMSASGPLAGQIIAKKGPRFAVIIGGLLCVFGLAILGFHSQIWQFYIAYGVFLGLGLGIGGLIAFTTVASNWFVKRAPLAMSIAMGASGVGGMIMSPVIMATIGKMGWRPAYLALCFFVLFFGVVIPGMLIRNKPEDLGQVPDGVPGSMQEAGPRQEARKKQYVTAVDFTLKEAVKTRAFWCLIVYITAMMFMLSLVMAHFLAFLTDIGIRPEIAATTFGLVLAMNTLGTVLMGFFALKIDLKTLNVAAIFLVVLGMSTLLITKTLVMAMIGAVPLGFGIGLSMTAGITLTPAYFGRTHFPKLIGIAMAFSMIGSTGAPIAGAIYDATKSYSGALVAAVVVGLIGLISVIMLKPPLHPSLGKTR